MATVGTVDAVLVYGNDYFMYRVQHMNNALLVSTAHEKRQCLRLILIYLLRK